MPFARHQLWCWPTFLVVGVSRLEAASRKSQAVLTDDPVLLSLTAARRNHENTAAFQAYNF